MFPPLALLGAGALVGSFLQSTRGRRVIVGLAKLAFRQTVIGNDAIGKAIKKVMETEPTQEIKDAAQNDQKGS